MFLYTHFHFSSLYWVETKYIYYDSKLLAPVSTLLIRLKLVYGLFGNTNMYSTLDISQELETNLLQHKRSKALTVPIHILCLKCSTYASQCQIGLLFFPLHYFHSYRDGLGVKKSKKNFLQINLFCFCARIEPKLNKLQKTIKIDKKSSKNPCFLQVF